MLSFFIAILLSACVGLLPSIITGKILILDEATSALDSISETAIQDAVQRTDYWGVVEEDTLGF